MWIKVIRVSSHGHVSEFKWEKYIFTWYISELWHKLCHFIWHKHNSQKNPKYIIKVHWDWAYRITGTPLSLSLSLLNNNQHQRWAQNDSLTPKFAGFQASKTLGKKNPQRLSSVVPGMWPFVGPLFTFEFSKIYITVGTFLML